MLILYLILQFVVIRHYSGTGLGACEAAFSDRFHVRRAHERQALLCAGSDEEDVFVSKELDQGGHGSSAW